jgi:hypothetical protein
MQHRAVADSGARRRVGSIEDGLTLQRVEMIDQPQVGFLVGDRQDTPDLLDCAGDAVFHEVHERLDRGEPGVSGARAIDPD